MSITIKDVTFNNIPKKKQGIKIGSMLTQSNIGISDDIDDYIQSEEFYKLVSALDIDWNAIQIDKNVVINDTADLINWIKSLEINNQGDAGVQGLPGIQGQRGQQGLSGDQGIKGDSGSQGPTGGQGQRGQQGLIGTQGAKGDSGSQGPTGGQGQRGQQGLIGTQGAKGDSGSQGPTGGQGSKGTQGAKGSIGSQGPQGLKGEQGNAGQLDESIFENYATKEYVNIGISNLINSNFVSSNIPNIRIELVDSLPAETNEKTLYFLI